MLTIKLYTDAATRGNPGPSSAGVLIVTEVGQQQLFYKLPPTSNHHAEFLAAIKGFEAIINLYGTTETILFHSDSKIVISSIEKNYSKSYPEALATLVSLQEQCELVINRWISEKNNKGAHALALQGLHKFYSA
nr:ribonuclease HI family protein [Liquorilactobacillus aquaticus]